MTFRTTGQCQPPNQQARWRGHIPGGTCQRLFGCLRWLGVCQSARQERCEAACCTGAAHVRPGRPNSGRSLGNDRRANGRQRDCEPARVLVSDDGAQTRPRPRNHALRRLVSQPSARREKEPEPAITKAPAAVVHATRPVSTEATRQCAALPQRFFKVDRLAGPTRQRTTCVVAFTKAAIIDRTVFDDFRSRSTHTGAWPHQPVAPQAEGRHVPLPARRRVPHADGAHKQPDPLQRQ
jgi:hypothetical protein